MDEHHNKTVSKPVDCNASISLMDESLLTTSKHIDDTLNGGPTVHNMSKNEDTYDLDNFTTRNHSPTGKKTTREDGETDKKKLPSIETSPTKVTLS